METFRKNWFVILLILAIGGGLFYWYGYRPTQIRHDCSWVLRQNLIPKEEVCVEHPVEKGSAFNQYVQERMGGDEHFYLECLKRQEQRKIKIQEPGEYWGKATDKEYDFCIQESWLR